MSNKYFIPASKDDYEIKGRKGFEYLKWKGFVDNDAVLRAILNANADAVTASWRTYGKHDSQMAQILDGWTGLGKDNFTSIMNSALKTSKICGNYLGELVYDEVDGIDGDVPVNMIPLPMQRWEMEIVNGICKKYIECHTGEEFRPEKIFHLAYNPLGAQCFGNSMIEPMQNILIYRHRLINSASKIFNRYIKPTRLITVRPDRQNTIDDIANKWKQINDTEEGDMFISEDQVTKVELISVPQYSILDPANWHRVLLDYIMMSSRTSEQILGTGTVNSEESSRMQMMGFRQMVRFDQKWLANALQSQVFRQIYPEDTPAIKFSFAAEGQEERWDRLFKTYGIVSASNLDESLKRLVQIKLLIEAGLIEDE